MLSFSITLALLASTIQPSTGVALGTGSGIIPGSGGPPPVTFPVNVSAFQNQSAVPDTATTAPVDITGATSVWVSVSRVFSASTVVIDSVGNIFTALSVNTGGAGNQGIIQFCKSNPTTSATYTVTATNNTTGNGLNMAVDAFNGTVGASCPDVQSQNSAGSNSVQPGSVTPPNNNSLLVTAVALNGQNVITTTIDSGFMILDSVFPGSGQGFALATAYLKQITAAPVNLTWTFTGQVGSASIGVAH